MPSAPNTAISSFQQSRSTRGENIVEIAFTAGDEALNRHDEFLYSLFVPARASQAFPCFDQPDIKGSLSLSLEIPAAWAAVSNAPEIGRETSGDRATVRFGQTAALPTYLFGFAAGQFSVERGERNGRAFHMYHRETDADKVAANRETIFDLHQQAIDWLETYTDRKYPFQKLDFVLLPAFQFGGMEHAGAIFYNAPFLFLDKTATQNQHLARANLIAHETAHMWFGDLVTMKWFDDVWLKEVFANFMAAKIVNPTFPDIDHELRFFLQHYPPAYDVDRTAGTNPIRQTLDNLKDAGSLYGPIIYQKAPIVMRQLEQMLGPDELRDGLREYLTRFAFGNATWTDLIEILDRAHRRRPRGLEPRVGRASRDGRRSRRTSRPRTARCRGSRSRSRIRAAARSAGTSSCRSRSDTSTALASRRVKMDGPSAEVPRVGDLPLPNYVLANGEGTGYGLFALDDRSRQFFLSHLSEIGDGLTRGIAWVTLWDDMLEGKTEPRQLFDLALRTLPQEPEELNVERILALHARRVLALSLGRRARGGRRPPRADAARGYRDSASTTSLKSAYFAAFRRTVTTPDGIAYLDRVWRRQEPIPGADVCGKRFHRHGAGAGAAPRGRRPTRSWPSSTRASPIRTGRRASRSSCPRCRRTPRTRDAFFASLARAENRAAGAMGRRRPAISESPAPPQPRRAVHPAEPGAAAGDPADRRHLLSARLDECRARRPQLPCRGTDRHGISGGAEGLPAAPAPGHRAECGSADTRGAHSQQADVSWIAVARSDSPSEVFATSTAAVLVGSATFRRPPALRATPERPDL